mgnify:CR=1 FL=1
MAGENTYGVLLGELRKIVKQIGKNHELDLELWKCGNTESMWIAAGLRQKERRSK